MFAHQRDALDGQGTLAGVAFILGAWLAVAAAFYSAFREGGRATPDGHACHLVCRPMTAAPGASS